MIADELKERWWVYDIFNAKCRSGSDGQNARVLEALDEVNRTTINLERTRAVDIVVRHLTDAGLVGSGLLGTIIDNLREDPAQLDLGLLYKFAFDGGGRRTKALREAGYLEWEVTDAGMDALRDAGLAK